jgi:hypothetical protein
MCASATTGGVVPNERNLSIVSSKVMESLASVLAPEGLKNIDDGVASVDSPFSSYLLLNRVVSLLASRLRGSFKK